MRPALDIHIRRSASLTPAELEEIWALTERYVDTSRSEYERQLLALPEIALWRARSGPLAGLVGLDVHTVDWRGRTRIIIFTASVVAEERFRGRHLVLRTGLRLLLREKLRRPLTRAYWFFGTYSYKSYLILARNFREFWPRLDRATPEDTAAFIGALARARFGSDWHSATGIVRRSSHKQLRPETAPIEQPLRCDPDVSYFEVANPGHTQGDMLVCLGPLTAGNLLSALKCATRRAPRG